MRPSTVRLAPIVASSKNTTGPMEKRKEQRYIQKYRQCDLWHVYKRATESGLPAGMICTQPNGRKHKNLIFYGDCTVQFLLTFDTMKGGTSQNLTSFYFHNSWFYWEIMNQNVNFPIEPV